LLLVQSVPTAQPPPFAHLVLQLPPQSTAVSVPFFTPSLHVSAVHAPLVHLPLAGSAQSALPEQPSPTGHFVAQEPPQSTSVSPSFFTASLHVPARQRPPEHLPLLGNTQSAFVPQPWPTPQPVQVPPQSTAVSVPFCTPSLHVAAWHVPATQCPLPGNTPSAFELQPWAVAHLVGQDPPQSAAVSLPFCTPSLQLGV
jgi:hypothetical protein